MSSPSEVENEIKRIRRVSDMLCSGHASLRDRYERRALLLDIAILCLSSWLVGLTFVDPATSAKLTPFEIDPKLWIGLLGIGTFTLTLVQMKTDWKARSDVHGRTVKFYAEVKREASYALSSNDFSAASRRKVVSSYELASTAGAVIPDKEFLAQKRKHKIKVEISRQLDVTPAAWPWLIRLKMLWMHNTSNGGNGDG